MKDFKSWLGLRENAEAGLINAIKSGDHVAFLAYLDHLEETGKPIPPELVMWRTLPELNRINVRWMIRRDVPEVLVIDEFGTNDNLLKSDDDITNILRDRNYIGKVAEDSVDNDVFIKGVRAADIIDRRILGYIIYHVGESSYDIVRLAVHPLIRKQGVGRAIINRLKKDVTPTNNSIGFTNHPEEMRGFLKKNDFQGIAPTSSRYNIP